MKIAVNTRLLLANRLEGIGWFTYENFKRICRQHPEHEFYFLFDRQYSNEFIFSDNIKPFVLPPQARHPVLYHIWFNFSVPFVLRKIKADLFISPDGYLPLHSPVKTLGIIHDINYEHYPKDIPPFERFYYRRYFPKFARNATRLATVSEYSRNDIARCFGVDHGKIDVVFNGANEIYGPVDESVQQKTRLKYTEGKPYLFYVGAIHPRKNLVNLLKAYDAFRSKTDREIALVIVGAPMWKTSHIFDTYSSLCHKKDVVFCGRLEPEELKNLFGSALALTYVSYFEGFGIPIVEAFYCDTPVITSNVTSMPEVAGDAALFVDPFSVETIADAMLAITSNETLRKSLIEKGRLRRQLFSWQRTSGLLWDSILKTVES